jgi:hypothetical protein
MEKQSNEEHIVNRLVMTEYIAMLIGSSAYAHIPPAGL